MVYAVEARVRVVSLSDGRTLHARTLDYRGGAEHRFTEWAADDAKRFRRESRRAGRLLGQAVLDQLFW